MKALELARRLIQAVEDEGENMECLIEVVTEGYDPFYVEDKNVGELAVEHRDGLSHPKTIKLII